MDVLIFGQEFSDSAPRAPMVIEVPGGTTKKMLSVIIGSADVSIEAQLLGEGAAFEHHVLYFGADKDAITMNVSSRHLAQDTKATMIIHGVATGKSTIDFTGSIFIEPGAQNTEGILEHEGILMSRGARIRALPGFEIHTNDVTAKHSSAVHYIRPEQLFYLQSRGIEIEHGRRMIVEGFLQDMLLACDDMAKREELITLIDARISAHL